MRKYILILTILFFATPMQGRRWVPKISGGGGGGGGVVIGTPNGQQTQAGTTTVHSFTGLAANTMFVAIACNEGDAGTPDFTITDNLGTPLTYTLRASSPATTSTGNINLWTSSLFTAGGNITITITCATSGVDRNSCVIPFTGTETSFSTTVPTPVTLQSTVNISVTTPVNACYVVWGTSDWSATSGTITYRNGETAAYDPGAVAGQFRGFYAYKLVSTASTANYGTTAPTAGANMTTCAVVIRPP